MKKDGNSGVISELLLNSFFLNKNKVAVVYEGKEVTYEKIFCKAMRFAQYIKDKGWGRGDIIAVAFDPSIDMIVVILGIILSGAAYLPISKNNPIKRLNYLLYDSNCKVLVSDEKLTKNTLVYEEDKYKGCKKFIKNDSKKEDLIYVIYTSGSTGTPKGVMVMHKNLYSFVEAITEIIDFRVYKSMLLLSNISFDISVLEMLVPLMFGAKVVIVPQKYILNIRKLLCYIKENKVDILQFTPSRLKLITMVNAWEEYICNVKKILVGGEKFEESMLKVIDKAEFIDWYNMYGPTESTIWSTCGKIEKDKSITIGRPLSNTGILILDDKMKLVKINEIGKIYIYGDGVSKGYINNEGLTEKKFVYNSEINEIIYDTGDLGKWDDNGNIVFEGREDEQLKINGYRIECEEIRKNLVQMEGIRDVCIIKVSNNNGEYLHVFYTGRNYKERVIYDFLKEILPLYMLPRHFTYLIELPMNVNGKRDRKKLELLVDNV